MVVRKFGEKKIKEEKVKKKNRVKFDILFLFIFYFKDDLIKRRFEN